MEVYPGVEITTYLSKKPRDKVAKDNGLVGLGITGRRGNATNRPQIAFPFVQVIVCGACVEKEDSRSSINQPATIEGLDSSIVHGLDGVTKGRGGRVEFFDLDRGLGAIRICRQCEEFGYIRSCDSTGQEGCRTRHIQRL